MRNILDLCATLILCCLLAGCNGSNSVDPSKLPAPVNAAVITNPATNTQVAAADALGRIGLPAVPQLAQALLDTDSAVRLQACRALAYMGSRAANAVPALERALSDPEVTVREEAAIALGQIGPAAEPAVPTLMQMLRSK